MTTPSSVPAQGEAMTIDELMEQAQVFASAWSLVGGRFDFGDGLRQAEEAKAELRSMLARALVAASPCETKVDRWLSMVRLWVERDGGDMDAALAWMYADPPAAAQGGQQPVEEITEEMLRAADAAFKARDMHAARVVYAGIYRAMRAAAPAAPAAPLTFAKLMELAHRAEVGVEQYGGEVAAKLERFARAIEAAHGITLAGTAQKGGERG